MLTRVTDRRAVTVGIGMGLNPMRATRNNKLTYGNRLAFVRRNNKLKSTTMIKSFFQNI